MGLKLRWRDGLSLWLDFDLGSHINHLDFGGANYVDDLHLGRHRHHLYLWTNAGEILL